MLHSLCKLKRIAFALLLALLEQGAFASDGDGVVCLSAGKPIYMADPCAYISGGVYYLTGTSPSEGKFEYYYSTDLRDWHYGGVLLTPGVEHNGDNAFWAPDVKEYKGKFYMAYSCYSRKRKGIMTCLAVSESPRGPFRDLYAPWVDMKYSAIDCDIFVDSDGQPYLYYSHNYSDDGVATGKIYAVRLKKDLSGIDGEPQIMSEASQEWERVNWAKNRCNEGPWVLKHKNKYYMTYSANDTGYEHYGVGVQTADSPLGPWTKSSSNPLLFTRMDKGISSPGHNCIVSDGKGNSYIIYHRHADPNCKKPNWNRIICIQKIKVKKNGITVSK